MQKKLTLKVDELVVDSFQAQADSDGQMGTVHGLASLGCDTLYDGTCRGYGTCGIYPRKPIP
ncbi:MAG TPA: hypothetical protein VFH27_15715 [Longimicrobiaceae bacterium]|nr:hypothetical protein [Longimicrobiaceae bacterium]